jgi:hypothetical protein
MEKGQAKGWQAIVLGALVILLLYVLSIGPSALLFGKRYWECCMERHLLAAASRGGKHRPA